jgi:YD repeat-containing protein
MVRVWRNIAAAILVTIVPTIKAAPHTRARIEPISGAILPQLRAAFSKPHFVPFLQGPTAGPVNYVYDELGRLIAAIDASGNAAVYSYDPVGNIVSIHRYASTDLATISFTPKQGPSNTTVTITGTGFSSVTSANSVQFNGVSATVISSTPNQIVTAVPNGATTGPLTISSPAGTVTTADSFTVTNSNGKPRIDSFAPQIVAAGAVVTMAGANFDTVPANDRLIMDLTDFNPTSATATSMAISVPSSTGSGHISLNTPNGTVTSTGDLYIAPNAFAVSSIASTGRTTSGVPATVALAANKAGMLIIDGKKGQMISAVASNSTFGSGCLFVAFDPFNGNVGDSHSPGGGQASGQCTSSGGFFDSQPLAATGTYTFVVSSSTSSGHVTLTPYLFDDIKGNVTLNSSITATTTFPGQNIRYQLFGSTNQHISISITSSPFSNCTLSIINPDGTALISTATCNSSTGFIDVPVLPQNGFYTIVLDPIGASTGTVVFKVNDATDVTGTIPTDGTQVTVNTTVPGQNAKLTFAGTAGQLVSAIFQDVSFSSGISMVLLDPTGAQVNGPGSIWHIYGLHGQC